MDYINKIAKLICEDIDDYVEEYYIEIALVGPKTKNSNRKLGEYLLPHNLTTIDWTYIENPAYLELVYVYDLSHDQKSLYLQPLKEYLINSHTDSAEIILYFTDHYYKDTHETWWQGSRVPNAPKKEETYRDIEFKGAELVLYLGPPPQKSKSLRINESYGHKIFEAYLNQIENR